MIIYVLIIAWHYNEQQRLREKKKSHEQGDVYQFADPTPHMNSLFDLVKKVICNNLKQ